MFSLLEERPWAKHEPSPTASPCGSILKKRQVEEDSSSIPNGEFSDQEESLSVSKNRRVSFADPPVSEKVVIPSTQSFKVYKAQKRLDMTRVMNSAPQLELENVQNSQDDEEISMKMPNCSQPIFSSLVDCEDPIDKILPKLTSSSLAESLKAVFKDRDIETVGDLCSLSEKELTSLPVRSPKKSNTIKCLKQYEESLNKKA
ncbi:Telomere-associated protein RIF1 [Armadillidium vulgare]|nr:Telomere-associated protein RIF1 [Armadillidium vulgare]